MVIYLDDILLMNQSPTSLRRECRSLLDLLESLGFLVNFNKSELTPSTCLTFLGFKLNTSTMSIILPQKVSSTLVEIWTISQAPVVSGRRLPQLVSMLSATIPAVLPAPLHYRGLQHLKHQALRQGGYDSLIPLSPEAQNDLQWWAQNLHLVNG